MRKWIKRSLLGVALVMALGALFLTGGFVLLRGTPDYYRKTSLTTAQRADAAARAESKLSQMQNLAADTHGAELQKLSGATRPVPIPGSRTFSFTDDELNALFNKWAEVHGWKDILSRVVEEPMVVLQEGRVILVGKVNLEPLNLDGLGKDTVVSIQFVPQITPDGRFNLQLDRVLGGKLPLDAVVAPMREKVAKRIRASLPGWQARAEIAPNGATNVEAMKTACGKLLLHTLADELADPVLFLPLVSRGSMTVPVRLTDVKITPNAMSITVVPMDAPERARLLEQIKAPLQMGNAATGY